MKSKTIDVSLETLRAIEARTQTSIEHPDATGLVVGDVIVFRHQPADDLDSKGKVVHTPEPIKVEVTVKRFEQKLVMPPRTIVHFEPRQRALFDLFAGGGGAR